MNHNSQMNRQLERRAFPALQLLLSVVVARLEIKNNIPPFFEPNAHSGKIPLPGADLFQLQVLQSFDKQLLHLWELIHDSALLDGAEGREEIALKDPSATGREVALDPALDANSLRHSRVARPLRGDQMSGLRAMALRLVCIFRHTEFSTMRQHHITGFEVVD